MKAAVSYSYGLGKGVTMRGSFSNNTEQKFTDKELNLEEKTSQISLFPRLEKAKKNITILKKYLKIKKDAPWDRLSSKFLLVLKKVVHKNVS